MPEPQQILRLTILALVACLAGCQSSPPLNTEYGKILGRHGSASLNGVSVFADMFEQRGFRVKHRNKISPRINQYDTLVWFPDRDSCPTEEAIDALNLWLSEGYMTRTLIYVGRDYDCQIDYLISVLDAAPAEQKEEMLRRLAESRLAQDERKGEFDFWISQKTTSCEWFEHAVFPRTKTDDLSGPMVEEPAGDSQRGQPSAELEYATLLAPRTGKDRGRWESEPLLDVDGHPFAFRLTRPQNSRNNDGYGGNSENQILVVSNGSFLLNYDLVDPANRRLAGQLITRSEAYGDVLFLESGPGKITVSDSDTTNHNAWAWIAEAPLRYIVPHFLMWGILFCFVFFPIFGRPRKRKIASTSNFRYHVNAMGKLFGRSNQPNQAVRRIQKYQQTINSESNRIKTDL